nr:PREDICTED: serine/threonine-protein phosphatase 2A 55 kDa regulatory subunit B beta isoform [Struthio camelus australis]
MIPGFGNLMQDVLWCFSQVKGTIDIGVTEADIISTVEFNHTGELLATGDKGGRVVIFQREQESKHQPHRRGEYNVYSTFQSHEPEFDYLKSLEIEEKINKIRWLPQQNAAYFLLSTNDKTVKLWKVSERDKRPEGYNLKDEDGRLRDPSMITTLRLTMRNFEENKRQQKKALTRQPKRTCGSGCPAGAGGWRAGLRVSLDLPVPDIVDIKPVNMEELTEVITAAEFHPHHCNTFVYSSSKGTTRLCDMRTGRNGSELCLCSICLFYVKCKGRAHPPPSPDAPGVRWESGRPQKAAFIILHFWKVRVLHLTHVVGSSSRVVGPRRRSSPVVAQGRSTQHPQCPAPCTRQLMLGLVLSSSAVFEEPEDPSNRSFFSEIISSISDVKFSHSGRYIMTRDYLTVKVWDLNMENRPIETYQVHDYLRSKLCSLYENDCIFDKFECVWNGSDSVIMTGSYNNFFRMFDRNTKRDVTLEASRENSKPRAILKPRKVCVGGKRRKDEISVDSLDFSKKILHTAWHPSENIIAVAATNNLYIFQDKVN